MRPADDIERRLKHMSFRAGPAMDKDLWAGVSKVRSESHRTGPAAGRDHVARTVMGHPIAKVAVAAAAVFVALILWRTVPTSRAYGLSDIPGLIGQARTIHIRSRQFTDDEELLSEYWYDAEKGTKYEYRESLEHEQGPNGPQTTTTRAGVFPICLDNSGTALLAIAVQQQINALNSTNHVFIFVLLEKSLRSSH